MYGWDDVALSHEGEESNMKLMVLGSHGGSFNSKGLRPTSTHTKINQVWWKVQELKQLKVDIKDMFFSYLMWTLGQNTPMQYLLLVRNFFPQRNRNYIKRGLTIQIQRTQTDHNRKERQRSKSSKLKQRPLKLQPNQEKDAATTAASSRTKRTGKKEHHQTRKEELERSR